MTTIRAELRYRFLHNHLDLVLNRALRGRPDVVVARIPVPLRVDDDPAWAGPAERD